MTPNHSHLSPKSAARSLGVSESSVKRWCDQGLIESTRTAGGHRKITTAEIVHFAQQHGSLLASPDQLELALSHPRLASPSADSAIEFAGQLLTGDALTVRGTLITRFLNKEPLGVLFDELVTQAFRIIGERWSCSSADVYQERRGCQIILSLFADLKQYLRPGLPGQLAIGATTSDDQYELPSAMAELVLREQQFQTQNLGMGIPFHSLSTAVNDLRPRLFWLSVSHIADEATFVQGFKELSSACSAQGTVLVVGGRALNATLRPRLVYSAYCDTMQQLATLAGNLQVARTDMNLAHRK